jgi:hypothetical protein
MKLPGQHVGAVSDRNVQSVDILPTIADAIDARLPWRPDGVSALAATPAPSMKRIEHQAATRTMEIDVDDLAARRDAAVRRKVRWFGTGSIDDVVPIASAHADLVGRKVSDLRVFDSDEARVFVEQAGRYLNVDPHAAVVPASLSGVVDDWRGQPRDSILAIAINGVVRATTSTYRSPRGSWTALIPPRAFRAGRNEVEVFVIDDANDTTRLRRAFALGNRPQALNLLSTAASAYWAIAQEGLHGVEPGPDWYRWTEGDARVTVPASDHAPPRSLRIGLWAVPPGGTPVRLTVNDCVVFDGRVESGPWFRTYSLDRCRLTMGAAVRIDIASRHFTPGGRDQRTLGVGVATLNLYDDPWPPPDTATGTSRGRLEVVDSESPVAGPVVTVLLENLGDTIWLGPEARGSAGLELSWRAIGQSRVLADQIVPLTHSFYPRDRERIALPARPSHPIPGEAWELSVQPLDTTGRPITLEAACRVEVGAHRPPVNEGRTTSRRRALPES